MTPQRHKFAKQRLEGFTYEEIAAANKIHIQTVYWHFKKISQEIGARRHKDFYLCYLQYCESKGLRTPNLGAILSALESRR